VRDELALSGALHSVRQGTAPESGGSRDPRFDYEAYLRRRGIAAELLLDRARATGRRRGGVAGVLDRMRERAQRAVAAGMPADRAALLRGMVLGEDDRIDESTRDDWRDSGLAHLLSGYAMARTFQAPGLNERGPRLARPSIPDQPGLPRPEEE